jgi:PHP family Zn ribbon phosphoesterase
MVVSDEKYNERVAICRQCEHRFEILNITEQCQKCGCIIPIKAKIEVLA